MKKENSTFPMVNLTDDIKFLSTEEVRNIQGGFVPIVFSETLTFLDAISNVTKHVEHGYTFAAPGTFKVAPDQVYESLKSNYGTTGLTKVTFYTGRYNNISYRDLFFEKGNTQAMPLKIYGFDYNSKGKPRDVYIYSQESPELPQEKFSHGYRVTQMCINDVNGKDFWVDVQRKYFCGAKT